MERIKRVAVIDTPDGGEFNKWLLKLVEQTQKNPENNIVPLYTYKFFERNDGIMEIFRECGPDEE